MEKEYKVIMRCTYETEIIVFANNQKEAIAKAEADDDRFAKEMEQCNVTTETYKIEK